MSYWLKNSWHLLNIPCISPTPWKNLQPSFCISTTWKIHNHWEMLIEHSVILTNATQCLPIEDTGLTFFHVPFKELRYGTYISDMLCSRISGICWTSNALQFHLKNCFHVTTAIKQGGVCKVKTRKWLHTIMRQEIVDCAVCTQTMGRRLFSH